MAIPLIKLLFKAISPKTIRQFNQQCSKARKTQEDLLLQMIKLNKDCAFGKKHNFDQIRSLADFQKQVPLATYDDLAPFIDASLNGEPAQLTQSTPVFYGMTSGTTGKPKYIPVTPESKALKSQLLRVWFSKLFVDHPKMFDGKVLAMVSPEVETISPAGVPCGAESGHGYRSMPKVTKSAYCAPYEVYAEKDYDAKYYTLLRLAAEQNITFVYTVNPSTVLLMVQRLNPLAEEIIKDIRQGTLSDQYPISDALRQQLQPGLKPNPARADELETALRKRNGQLLPKDIWPNLAVIACWKGGSVGIYLDKFDQYFRENLPVRDVGYYASEHRGSVPITDDDSSGVLAIPVNVYEFFPARYERKPNPDELLGAHELEKGQHYFIYVTTLGGLYRYDMNDIVEVTGFHDMAPLIRFVQKGSGTVSFTGEKLYEAQAIEAVNNALNDCKGQYEFIAAVGEMIEDAPRYVFLIEFTVAPDQATVQGLANKVEQELSALNIEYESKRKSMRINPLAIRIIKPGEFDNYRKRKVQEGRNDGQFKILKLTKDVTFAKEFASDFEVAADND